MAKNKQHEVVLREVSNKKIRREYVLIFNGVEQRGKVIKTRVKGVEVWFSTFNGQRVEGYDPEWLLARNGRKVKLAGHPCLNFALTTKPVVNEQKLAA